MRARPIGTMPFSIVGIVCVNVFVFQLCLLLFVVRIVIPLEFEAMRAVPLPMPITPIAIVPRLPWDLALPPYSVKVEPCPPEVFESRRAIASRELSRYPLAYLNRIGLRQIVLCSSLEHRGKEVGGIALAPLNTIVLTTLDKGEANDENFRRALHHELFHLMDDLLMPSGADQDSWARLNPEGFRYGGEEIHQILVMTRLNPLQRADIAGFIDHYSMVDAREDRAEVYSYMVVFPDELEALAREDGIIAKKVRRLRRELDLLTELPGFVEGGHAPRSPR